MKRIYETLLSLTIIFSKILNLTPIDPRRGNLHQLFVEMHRCQNWY